MARSLCGAKAFVSLVADNICFSSIRRGYAAATQGAIAQLGRRESGRMVKVAQEEMGRSTEKSWVPDPVTGYYRPANRVDEIDVADLREIFLNQKKFSPQ